jgi:hypothetical protein
MESVLLPPGLLPLLFGFVVRVLPGLGELPLGGFGGEYGGFVGGLFVGPLVVGALVVGVM